MGRFFQQDGPLNKFGSYIADVIILSLLWFICSLPVFTIGPSTTAFYYAATRRIANLENSGLKDFKRSFKQNLISSTCLFIILALVGLLLLFNVLYVPHMPLPRDIRNILLAIQYVFVMELFLTTIYAFPLLARFEMKLFVLLKTSFLLANKHILHSLACTVLALVSFWLAWQSFMFLFPLAFGIYVFLSSYCFMHIFHKYRPEINQVEKEDRFSS